MADKTYATVLPPTKAVDLGDGTHAVATAQSTLVANAIAKAYRFNTALPVAESDLLAADITPTKSPSYVAVYFIGSVSGILRRARTVGGVTVDENLNSGVALTAGAAYGFVVPWRTGDALNFEYSVTTGTFTIIVDEIGG